MSTRYITALLSPDRAPSVLNVGHRRPERGQQFVELDAVGPAEANGVVRAQPRRQQLEATVAQPGGCRHVDHAVGGEAGAQQLIERDVQDGEDRDAQQRLAVERPGPGGSMGMAGQLVPGVGATSDQDRSLGKWLFGAQPAALLDPAASHPSRLAPDRGRPWQDSRQAHAVSPSFRSVESALAPEGHRPSLPERAVIA